MQIAKAISALLVMGASGLLLGVAAPRAEAQFSTLVPVAAPPPPRPTDPAANKSETPKTSVFAIGLYPYAPFETKYTIKADGFKDTPIGDKTNGFLIAPEAAFLSNGKSGLGVGGWYWVRTQSKGVKSNFYEGHVKYYFTPNIGLQVGYLGNSSNEDALGEKGVNGYVTYQYASPRPAGAKAGSFSASIGLGVQNYGSFSSDLDLGNGLQKVELFKSSLLFAGFVSGGYEVFHGFSVNLSYWLVSGDRKVGSELAGLKVSANRSRFAAGVSYQF